LPEELPLLTASDSSLLEEQRTAIAEAARELDELRTRRLNPPEWRDEAAPTQPAKRTLTNLYNQRPTWLGLAPKKLDEAVFAARG
jgi:hypothetical protein